MDTSRYIQSCNPARFVITSCLLIFSILFALKLDGYIEINYWLVFLPLFIWKLLVIIGACTGIFVWCKTGETNRNVHTPDNDFRALIFYFLIHILIFVFEILICDKLENHLEFRWILCFVPMHICTFLSFISCLWSLRTQKNFLIQSFILLNGLLFLFFPLRLDQYLTWRYSAVFIPVWISLCIALIFVLSKFIFGIIHHCSRHLLVNQYETSTIQEAFIYAMMFIPLSIFSILLVERLDYDKSNTTEKQTYTIISIPLWITLIAWLTFSFGASDGNPWWFGLRRNFCEILLDRYPLMSLYFNNRFRFSSQTTHTRRNDLSTEKNLELLNPKHSSTIDDICHEETRVKQHHFISLLEPD